MKIKSVLLFSFFVFFSSEMLLARKLPKTEAEFNAQVWKSTNDFLNRCHNDVFKRNGEFKYMKSYEYFTKRYKTAYDAIKADSKLYEKLFNEEVDSDDQELFMVYSLVTAGIHGNPPLEKHKARKDESARIIYLHTLGQVKEKFGSYDKYYAAVQNAKAQKIITPKRQNHLNLSPNDNEVVEGALYVVGAPVLAGMRAVDTLLEIISFGKISTVTYDGVM